MVWVFSLEIVKSPGDLVHSVYARGSRGAQGKRKYSPRMLSIFCSRSSGVSRTGYWSGPRKRRTLAGEPSYHQ